MAQTTGGDLYIGLLSGTSLDGIDAGLFHINTHGATLRGFHHQPYPVEIKESLTKLCLPGQNEIDRAGALDTQLGRLFAQAALTLLKQHNLSAKDIRAIGSHGQTIRHRPDQNFPFTLQIGDPNTIAQTTQITTVADFRRRDMAAGGQGAPLAPAFHRAIFYSHDENRCIINIGGIANLSVITEDCSATIGYDSGPGNVLMDAWILHCLGKPYDENGSWAASGTCQPALLKSLLAHPYFARDYPKSTGREDFHLPWLKAVLDEHPPMAAKDVQATLCELTATSITSAVKSHECRALYICGGGAKNLALLSLLGKQLPNHRIETTTALGIDPDWVEAGLFAWLAKQTVNRHTVALSSITGAQSAVILGGIYPA